MKVKGMAPEASASGNGLKNRSIRVKFSVFLMIFVLSCFEARATTRCIYFIGSGSYFAPIAENTFQNDLKAMRKRWGAKCTEEVILFSTGQNTLVFDSEKNSSDALSSELKNVQAATKKNLMSALQKTGLKKGDELKVYLGDHGLPEGANAIDGTITPKMLGNYFTAAQNQGVHVKAVFDHCYSGNMLPSLYQTSKGAATSCGLASTTSRIGYDDQQFTNTTESIAKTTADGQKFAKLLSSSADNFNLSTSKKFLLDYSARFPQTKIYPQCNDQALDHLESKMGLVMDGLKSKVYSDLTREIAQFEKDSLTCKNNTPQVAHSSNLLDSPLNLSNWGNFQSIARTAFEKHMHETPGLDEISKKYKYEYSAIKTCVELHLFRAPDSCSEYANYRSAYLAYQKQEKVFEDQVTVKEVYSMNGKNYPEAIKSSLDLKASAYLVALQADLLTSTQIEVCEEKNKAYFAYVYALVHMMKTNDVAVIDTYRRLLACEQGEL